MDIQIVFLGTPDFAVPILQSLARNYTIAGVITQPDRPTGRGRNLLPSPVKKTSQELGLEIYQPVDINSPAAIAKIQEWDPELICVAAFGQLLGSQLLNLPPGGCLNVHASLLPRWRGASPINAAIRAGDTRTGITIMKMGPGLDDGPIVAQQVVEIRRGETAGSLFDRLAEAGAQLLVKTIPPYLEGKIDIKEQDEDSATYASMLDKNDGELDFSLSARTLARLVRAYSPWPGTFTSWEGKRLLIHKSSPLDVTSPGVGVFTEYEGQPAVGTGEGILILEELQLAGKKRLSGKDFLNGTPSWGKSNGREQQGK